MGFFDDDTDVIGAIKDFFGGDDSDSAAADSADSSDDNSWSTDDIRNPWAEDEIIDEYAPEEPAEEESVAAWASRQTTDSDTQTALDCGYEIRNIILARSIQFTRSQFNEDVRDLEFKALVAKSDAQRAGYERGIQQVTRIEIPEQLEPNESFGELKRISDHEIEFRSDRQRVIYRLLAVETKDRFIEALNTEGLIVVYVGHARYGRGPCFSPSDDPGEDWEEGSDPSTRGLFRMGYPIIGVHFSEIMSHGYSFFPVTKDDFPDGRIPRNLLHPHVEPGSISAFTLDNEMARKAQVSDSAGYPCSMPSDTEVFGTTGGDPMILLWAGWRDTTSRPYELAATEVKCRCLCLFGCSTAIHFQKILRDEYGFKQADDTAYSYFTSLPASAQLTKSWLESLFDYDQENAHQSWDKVMAAARDTANRRLAALGESPRVVG